MRAFCLLLLTVCLLFSQFTPGVGLLEGLGQRSDHYKCVRNGGTCHFSSCPLYTKIQGTCYSKRAKCCL
ncbi:PREDICTED: beta-defensin 1 [Galeopterus variegatus]|uniref:Beta-defensin 1 n=1 Tax=Galeopterus variegatus TaxID=482537 RepID=A0ABM0S9J4_GALVR|nr:PREDICTED: beta-defensin 1 [Galeopterus variegatus]